MVLEDVTKDEPTISLDGHMDWVEYDPIDSAYAKFVVVPATFTVAFSVMGVQYSAGVMNSAILAAFMETEGATAWVTAIAIGFLLLAMGPGGTIQVHTHIEPTG